MSKGKDTLTDGQIAEVVARRTKGQSFAKIAEALEKQYGIIRSESTLRSTFSRNQHLLDVGDDVANIKTLKEIARVKRTNSLVAKQNKTILANLIDTDDLLEQLQSMVNKVPRGKAIKAIKVPKVAGKTDMTVEALISDVHVGKLTDTFNVQVCRDRLRLFTRVLLQEIERKRSHYNVERLILAILGDLIENYVLHPDSPANCEFQNPEQIRYAIELLFEEVLVPLAMTRMEIDVVCVGGNHDRQDEDKTCQKPSKNGFGWVIYQTLKMLCDRAGFKNLRWTIPEGVYVALEVYGDHILYEHGDWIKGDNSRKAFLANITKRSAQLGVIIKGLRIGHWHEHCVYDNGRVIVNGSVPGQDSYADVQGFNSLPAQVINYYVRTKNRSSSYYHSLLVQLGEAAS